MLRFLLRRLVIIPIALMAINFLGYGYATLAQQVNAAANPFIARRESAPPLLSSYQAYLSGLFAPPDTQDAQAAEPVAVVPFVLAAAGNSLILLLLSFGLGAGLGLALGLFAVRTESGGVGRWLSPVASVGMALPSFFLGAILIAASIAVTMRAGPDAEPLLPFHGFGWDRHLVLPVLVLMVRPAVQIAKVMASLLAGESAKQYVVAAKSVGNDWRTIRRRHMLRVVIAPVVLTMAGAFRLLVAELVVVEWLFGWPGLGRLLAWTLIPPRLTNEVAAPVYLNPPMVATVFTAFAALFLVTDLVASLMVQVFDPRLRPHTEETGGEVVRA